MRHQCWSLVIVSTERGRQVGDEVLHHGLPRSRESPVYRRGHGESVFACASTLVRRGEYRAQTGIWRLLGFVSARTIKGRSSPPPTLCSTRRFGAVPSFCRNSRMRSSQAARIMRDALATFHIFFSGETYAGDGRGRPHSRGSGRRASPRKTKRRRRTTSHRDYTTTSLSIRCRVLSIAESRIISVAETHAPTSPCRSR